MSSSAEPGRKTVMAALLGNLAIAITKFVAAALTGSSSMLTESVHSLVDTGDQGLMLYGQHRSQRPADEIHPFGYGRELYFWSFVVALLLFSGGAGVSFYEGILHFRNPEPIAMPLVNYLVLALAAVFEGASWLVAFKAFRETGAPASPLRAFRRSKDPSVFLVVAEDSAALCGIVIAAVAISLALVTGDPRWDAAGSMLIGILLGGVALLLVIETKGLLIGERADPDVVTFIQDAIEGEAGVRSVSDVKTVQLAPDQIIAIASAQFEDDLATQEIEHIITRVEQEVLNAPNAVRGIYIRLEAKPEQAAR